MLPYPFAGRSEGAGRVSRCGEMDADGVIAESQEEEWRMRLHAVVGCPK